MKLNESAIKRTLGQTVRKYRMAAGITQEELAELTDLHRTYISDIERGSRNVAVINIVKLAKALKVKPGQLVAGL